MNILAACNSPLISEIPRPAAALRPGWAEQGKQAGACKASTTKSGRRGVLVLLIDGRQVKSSAVLWRRLSAEQRKRLIAKTNVAARVLQRRVDVAGAVRQ